MNLLTYLVFILCLGYLYCKKQYHTLLDDGVPLEIDEHCKKQENVGEWNIMNLNDTNAVRYYYCVFEKQGKVANGHYVGNFSLCKGVADDDKLKLAIKVVKCSYYRL